MSKKRCQPTPEAEWMYREIEKGLNWIRTNPETLVLALQQEDAQVLLTALAEQGEVDPAIMELILEQQLKHLIKLG